MTSVLAYSPMSDPFASHAAAQASAAAALRYPSPPLSPPLPPLIPPNPQSPSHAQSQYASKHSSSSTPPIARSRDTPTQTPPTMSSQRMALTPAATPSPSIPDEFGAAPSRPRTSHSIGPGMPLPLPQAVASTSATPAHAYAHSQPTASGPLVPSTTTPPNAAAASRKRQSHNPSMLVNSSPPKAEHLTDEYVLHPSVYAYKAAHPRRAMVGFGPYVLLQTLGEGEFGKVKLGVHTEYGVEVAIKLIRRGSLDDEQRAVKVEREIDVLKTLKHPNIVRMFDVIDTDKYIGIVLEFAGGGELFDHILANKYLKEKDAQRLFAQLISGVDYLHRKNIIHRDLKLENLLLDKHRNIIITDFGFANRFDDAADDLMSTSCGSPCYAAPELVVTEGMYIGSAVDVWSCGVILFAMLSGYLPYDDDPENPEGDNINQLYKYIMTTPLQVPGHVSPLGKHLLQIMMVPNPLHRCTIRDVMNHPWLHNHRELFERTVEMNEWIFQDQMYKKSQAAKKELNDRKRVQQEAKYTRAVQRSMSSMPGSAVTASMMDQRRTQRHHSALPGSATVADHLASSGTRTPPLATVARQLAPTPPLPADARASPVLAEATLAPQPRIASGSIALTPSGSVGPVSAIAVENEPHAAFTPHTVPLQTQDQGQDTPMSQNSNRHTIQVEYDADATYELQQENDRIESPNMTVPGTPLAIPLNALGDTDMSVSELGHFEAVDTPENLGQPALPAVVAPSVPHTPSKRRSDEDGPTTPRASMAPPREDQATPRAENTPRAARIASTSSSAGKGKQAEAAPTPAVAFTNNNNVVTPLEVAAPSRAGASASASVSASAPDRSALDARGLPVVPPPKRESVSGTGITNRRERKGMSLDKFGLSKLLGGAGMGYSSVDLTRVSPGGQVPPSAGSTAASLQKQQQKAAEDGVKEKDATQGKEGRRMSARPSAAEDKKGKRKTLQIMGSLGRSGSVRDNRVSTPVTPITPATPSTPGPLANRDMNPLPAAQTSTSTTTAAGKISPVRAHAGSAQPQAAAFPGHSSPSLVTADTSAVREKQNTASSSAAKKVMDWFRRKSIARDSVQLPPHSPSSAALGVSGGRSDTPDSFVRIDQPVQRRAVQAHPAMSSTSSIAVTAEEAVPAVAAASATPAEVPAAVPEETSIPAQAPIDLGQPLSSPTRVPLAEASASSNIAKPSPPRLQLPPASRSKSADATATLHPPASASATTTSLVPAPISAAARRPGSAASEDVKLRIHTGVVDQSALSSKAPGEVMREAVRVLLEMGMDVKRENEYRLRCTRARRRRAGEQPAPASGGRGLVGSVMSIGGSTGGFLMGNASSTRLDSRGLPMPQSPSILSSGGLKGMLRRGSSAASAVIPRTASESVGLAGSPAVSSMGGTPLVGTVIQPIYGEHSIDSGDEVKFNVELCRIKNLPGLYLLNIKRLKGNVWSFKFIYQTVLERCDTLTH